MRASYRKGVEWVALNDEPGEMNSDIVGGNLTVALIADLFGKTCSAVAEAVVRYRKKEAVRQARADWLSAAAERDYQDQMEDP